MNIKQEFPKAYELLKEWMKPRLLSFQESMIKAGGIEGSKIPELADEIVDKFVEVSLSSNIRLLYDFLDDKQLFMLPDYIKDRNEWYYYINDEYYSSDVYKNRTEAEIAGFNEALTHLNK